MKANQNPATCPKCGAPVPTEAPQGLCPQCVLAQAAAPTEPAPPPSPSQTPPIETVAAAFPHLEIVELVGSGGMGAVFKARQPNLDRWVALKILPEQLAKDPAFAERLSREARLLARLNHPGIVTVYDFGKAGHLFYLLMEYVDGVNLRQALAAGRFSAAEALRIVPKICEALQFAHDAGVLHRDIKPENILLDERGRVKIADFGIAKLVGKPPGHATLTSPGATIGTPHYMAPEQLERPQEIDQRADIYSLGVVFYELLTGELPLGRFALPSEKSPVDPRVDPIVLRSLERDREKRYSSATEVKTSVEGLGTPPTPQDGPPSRAPGGPGTAKSPPPRITAPDRVPGKALTAAILASAGLALGLLWLAGMALLGSYMIQGGSGIAAFEAILILGTTLLPLGFMAAGTFTGLSAVHDLQNRPPPRRGLGLATFSLVAGPLLVLDVLLGAVMCIVPIALLASVRPPGALPKVLALCAALLALTIVALVDFWILRRTWQWADLRRPARTDAPGRRGCLLVGGVGLVALAVALAGLLLLRACSPIRQVHYQSELPTSFPPAAWASERPELEAGYQPSLPIGQSQPGQEGSNTPPTDDLYPAIRAFQPPDAPPGL